MYPKQATRPEFAKFDRNTATNRRGAGIRNRQNAGTGAERFALLAFAKLENVATKVVADEIFYTFVPSNRPAFCGVDSNATTPQIIAAFRVKFRLNRQKLAKNKNTKKATR